MPTSALTHQVRSVLGNADDAVPIADLLTFVDDLVAECIVNESEIFYLEEELQSIYHAAVDYSSLRHTEIFLAVLYHLGPILPSTSIISWFDLILRPALREPKLSTQSVNHAKELVISAFQKTHEVYADKVGDFRRRLMELYLLDAYNEGSGEDVLEWAELTLDERQKRTRWKNNLEDILVRFGNERPEDLLNEVNEHFYAFPSSRLQLFNLLNVLTGASRFDAVAEIIPKHPLMKNIVYSLFLDTSSTACTFGITFIVKLLPFMAIHARDGLKAILPKLLAVLARIMCWKERRVSKSRLPVDDDDVLDVDLEKELENEANPVFILSSNTQWKRLEMTFDATTSMPPLSRPYFTALYYLYPANVLKFLRNSVRYLEDNDISSPYVQAWEQALDQDEIHRITENLVREHVCHPLLAWRNASVELTEPEFWTRYDVSRIISETSMLDLRKLLLGIQAHYSDDDNDDLFSLEQSKVEHHSTDTGQSPRFISPIDLSTGKAVISLQDMINIAIALKNNLDVEVIHPSSPWPQALLTSTSKLPSDAGSAAGSHFSPHEVDPTSLEIAEAVSGLQREVLLLRNDLNFELWLSRENAKHIGRLYQDRVLKKTAEAERQAIYNKIRKYRAQVNSLENELRDNKQQASSNKFKYADWNTELQSKLKELREEKKKQILEVAALRSAEKEAQVRFEAQGKLLAEALKEVVDLKTQKKENQHKIDRLHDYERQIEQHIKIQQMWNGDFAKFNDREDDIVAMQAQYKQMELRLESMEKSHMEMGESARLYRRTIQGLEAQLNHAKRHAQGLHIGYIQEEIHASVEEKVKLNAENLKLREDNVELREEVEELKAMVEVLRGQLGQGGLISEPRYRASPIIPSSLT